MTAESSIEELNTLFVEKLSLIHEDFVFVTTIEGLKDACLQLKTSTIIAFDCEGVSLSRSGTCTLLQLVGDSNQKKPFIIDLVVCTAAMLEESGIKVLLEDHTFIKICWDGRMDCDALLHQFNVRIHNILDLQVLDVFYRRSQGLRVNFVNGYAAGVEKYTFMSFTELTNFKKLKDQIDDLSYPQGRMSSVRSFEFWRERPLSQDLLQYATGDVLHMFVMRTKLLARIKKTETEMIKVSTLRIDTIRDSVVAIPNTRAFAQVNF